MNALEEITLADVVRGAKRYRPFLLLAAATFVLIGLLPAINGSGNEESGGLGQAGLSVGDQTAEGAEGATGDGQSFASGDATSAGSTVSAGGRASTGVGGVGGGGAPVSANALAAPDCDPATGKLRIPSRVLSPPCVPMWPAGANNGGATHQGVSATEIKLVVRLPQPDPAMDAAFAGLGVGDTPEQMKADVTDWTNHYNSHYETYGRKVKLIFFEGTGNDAATERADAIQVASEHKPFATTVAGIGGATYLSETAARGIESITYFPHPQSLYDKRAPFLWAIGAHFTPDGLVQTLANYVGKRLWGRPAKWAGDATMALQQRKFGLLYPGDMEKDSLDVFHRELAKYGASMADEVGIGGDTAQSASQVQTAIDKFKAEGINVVIPFASALTVTGPAMKHATGQRYFPEWVMAPIAFNGSVLITRTLDSAQTIHMYGLQDGVPPVTKGLEETERLFAWEYGRPPQGIIFSLVAAHELYTLFRGIHLAGPTLNPTTFKNALFNVATPVGGAAQDFASTWATVFGPTGKVWPWANYSGHADFVEGWWDATTTGADEAHHEAPGVFQHPNGAKRYLGNQIPSGEPNMFDPQGAVSDYDAPPPNEVAPPYPNKHCAKRC